MSRVSPLLVLLLLGALGVTARSRQSASEACDLHEPAALQALTREQQLAAAAAAGSSGAASGGGSESHEDGASGQTLTASPGQLPYAMHLKVTFPSGSRECSGVLLSETFVLTAAQCVYDAVSISASAGLTADSSGGSEGSPIVHPNFRRFCLANDIALVQLTTPIALSGEVAAVLVSSSTKMNSLDSEMLRVTGFGVSQGSSSASLLLSDLQQLPRAVCAKRTAVHFIEYPASMSCLDQVPSQGACIGDQGGAVLYQTPDSNYVLAGLVSSMPDCGSDQPAAYTRLRPYLTWIATYVLDLAYSDLAI